jgi:hypothetical protein
MAKKNEPYMLRGKVSSDLGDLPKPNRKDLLAMLDKTRDDIRYSRDNYTYEKNEESAICEEILRESGLWKEVSRIRTALGREHDMEFLPSMFHSATKDTSLSHKFNQRIQYLKREAEEKQSRMRLRYEDIDHKIRFEVTSIPEAIELIDAYRKEFIERK